MRFRPCIDLHKGKVKQIVGATYNDADERRIRTNYVTDAPAGEFAAMYRRDGLRGGHVIMLGPGNEAAALSALQAFPGGMQIGGGITPSNAERYLLAGASHVIVTSYVFGRGRIAWGRLDEMGACVGAQRLVLDLSCTRRDAAYFVVTDRWQHVTRTRLDARLLRRLAKSCDEFLVHAVDIEGRRRGVDAALVGLLAGISPLPVTYAGGVRSLEDLEEIRTAGRGRVDATVGSALDIFGGPLPYRAVVQWARAREGSGAA
jgi:phosphoribosylformimino-5-aminoimidazole carboxamide ribotide isomerase